MSMPRRSKDAGPYAGPKRNGEPAARKESCPMSWACGLKKHLLNLRGSFSFFLRAGLG